MQGLTYSQYQDWAVAYQQDPWGELRGDIRQEVFRVRLLLGLFGDGNEEMPEWMYPHTPPEKEDPREQLKKLKARWQQIQSERTVTHGSD